MRKSSDAPNATSNGAGSLLEIARLVTRLGATALGGPAAHIALLQENIVHKRSWIGQVELNQMLGLTNPLPGTNSTEIVMHDGYRRAGNRWLPVAPAVASAEGGR